MSPRERASRWLPHPVVSVVLLGLWLLLQNSIEPGQLLLAVALALVLPVITRLFWVDVPAFRSLRRVPGLLALFLWDLIVANVTVALLILNFTRTPRSHWIVIPLDLSNPNAVAVLANMISLTPGTVSSKLTPDRLELLVHVLDTDDPEYEVNRIKQRYELPLKEIFE